MAVLEKIRTKFGMAATIIIALGLLSFIIDPSEVINSFQNMSSKNDVGEIAGKTISYADFQEEIQNYTTISEMTSGSTKTAQQQEQIRASVWQDLISRYLFNKNARAAGIAVGDAEMISLTSGSNPSPLVAQLFSDENGNFSKAALSQFIETTKTDARAMLFWSNLKNSVENAKYMDKYAALFNNTNCMSTLMTVKQIEENNTTSDVEFVIVPANPAATDSTIVVADSEIKAYYNAHKKNFRQPSCRDIEYVVFEVEPSEKDIENTVESITSLVEEFAAAENVKRFLSSNSVLPFSTRYNKKGDLSTLSTEVEDFVWNSNQEVSSVIVKDNMYYVARVTDTKSIPDSAYVKHILLPAGSENVADSLATVIAKGEKFSTVASLYSQDKGSAVDGEMGNIGWMTQDYMIPGFESVLTADVNKPYVIKTQYGVHVVAVSKKTAPIVKKQVAVLAKEAQASNETFGTFYSKANNFLVAAAGSYENYRKAVDTMGVYSHPVFKMLESADRLGAIENTKEVTRWAFDSKEGKVSDIFTIDNKYFIVAVNKKNYKEGYAKLSDVASNIRQSLYFDKAAEKAAADVAKKIEGLTTLEAIAEKLGATVSSHNGVAFSSLTSQGLDPKFIGAVSKAPQGKVCGPVAGTIGTYIFKVNSRDTGAFYTENDAKNRNAQMTQYMDQMIIPVMMEAADVKDNRARFF